MHIAASTTTLHHPTTNNINIILLTLTPHTLEQIREYTKILEADPAIRMIVADSADRVQSIVAETTDEETPDGHLVGFLKEAFQERNEIFGCPNTNLTDNNVEVLQPHAEEVQNPKLLVGERGAAWRGSTDGAQWTTEPMTLEQLEEHLTKPT